MTRQIATWLLSGLLAMSIAALPAAAQSGAPPTAPGIIGRKSERPVSLNSLPPIRQFVTRHSARFNGRRMTYRATAGDSYIENIYGEPIARLFSFSYVAERQRDENRPVVFIFNGGPGSSSLWLHMGIFGPKRVQLSAEVNPASTPPFGSVDNPYGLLDVADLVFIDPVGTGFSHAVGNATDLDFAAVDVDADTTARFIEHWLQENGRWNSPKFVVGESYGTIRAAVLSRALVGGPFYGGVMRGITLDGVILIGASFSGLRPAGAPNRDAASSAANAFPSMAATAWYHGRVDRSGKTVGQFYEDARVFGAGDYATALRRLGAGTLDETSARAMADKLSAYTGLPASEWLENHLVIPMNRFQKHVIAERGLEVGTYDSRYTLPINDRSADPVADDAAMARYVPGFIASFHMMLRSDLKVRVPETYTAIAFGQLAFGWNYKRGGVTEGATFAADLSIAMRRNPALRVLVASGYYDLATPPATAMADIVEAGLPLDRVSFRNYESGHMLYLGDSARTFANDVRQFIGAPRAPRG